MSAVQASRVEAVDLARGLALLGMMLVHLGPDWSGDNPPLGDLIAGGRAAPLFALLAGVSLTLVYRRDRSGAGSVSATLVRAAILIVLGLALGSIPDMPVLVILAFYGLMIVAALPCRRLSTTTLLVVGAGWAVVAPVLLLWAQIEHGPTYTEQAAASDLSRPGDLLAELIVWGAYPAGVWFAYVLIGLAIGHLDLTRRRVSVSLIVTGACLVVITLGTAGLAVARGWITNAAGWQQLFAPTGYPFVPATWDELWMAGEHTSRPLNVLSAIGSALLVVGLCGLLARWSPAQWALTPLRAAGSMTLTLYTVHVLWTWRVKADSVSGGWGGYWDWALQAVVLCGFALLWQRSIGRGPLESVVRWLSLGMKKRPGG